MSETGELAAGTVVAGFVVVRKIGKGGAGTVYLAEEPNTKKRLAVKVLDRAPGDREARGRFEREARAANDAKHPVIVEVSAVGELADGRPYLVMPFLDGRSLRDEIAARGALGVEEAWSLAREIAAALDAAHTRGIVHRDLKPDNVFLERAESGESGATAERRAPRLLDFGLAKMRESEGEVPMNLTQSGAPLGTPPYMAPEQWWGAGVDARTDQYAFGILLFEMLAGRPPFDSTSFAELVQQHLHATPPSLASLGVEVPAALEAAIARTLAKDPRDRFASMPDVVDAIDSALGRDAIPPAPARVPASNAPAKILVRWAMLQPAVLAAGLLAIFDVGYAGDARRNLGEWFRLGGAPQAATLAVFLGAAVAIHIAGRRRARTGIVETYAWWLALLPAVLGALGTYSGWTVVERAIATPGTSRLLTANEGMYEANLARFLGFALSCVACLMLAAIPGLSGAARNPTTLPRAIGVSGRESAAAVFCLFALLVTSVAFDAASGAFIAEVAAMALVIGLALPARHPVTAARDELERGAAGLMAVLFAIAVGFARIEAREAFLWSTGATRAERAVEIGHAAAERQATTWLALASFAIVLVVELARLRRLWGRARIERPSARTLGLGFVLVAAALVDVGIHARFRHVVAELHEELTAQFTILAHIDPPQADLDPQKFAPHPAPALQVARTVIAVNGRPVAPMAGFASPEGRAAVAAELHRALATAAAEERDGSAELAIMIDKSVPFGVVTTLLGLARSAGVHKVEILFTRGHPFVAPIGAPPEIGYVLPGDFVAVTATLANEPAAWKDDAPFGEVMLLYIDLARSDRHVVLDVRER
jgi:tRNA A-37 threonylcarbamoyl transferase component Bud32